MKTASSDEDIAFKQREKDITQQPGDVAPTCLLRKPSVHAIYVFQFQENSVDFPKYSFSHATEAIST